MSKQLNELYAQGRYDDLEHDCRALLEVAPDHVEALYMLGMLRHRVDDHAEAARLFARAHALAPERGDIELSLGAAHYAAGDHDAAARAWERALALDPNLGGAHIGLGQIALLKGDRATAEQHFRIALRAGEDGHALTGLGALMLERGDHEGALRYLSRAAELVPDYAMTQYLLGQAFMRREAYAFAEQAFRNTLRLRPDMHEARRWLAEALLNSGRAHEAAAIYDELAGLPGYAFAAQVGHADVARAENRHEDAIAGYRAALALEPTQAQVVRVLAALLAELGRNDEVLATYGDYLAQVPDDRDMRALRADVLMLLQRLPEAAADWKYLAEQHPEESDYRIRLAIVEEYLGLDDAARADAEQVLQMRPAEQEMLLIRIRALLREGEDAAAHAQLGEYGRLPLTQGQRRLWWNYLGRVHDRAGQPAEAVRCFAEAQRGTMAAMPVLDEPHPALADALAEAPGPAWAQAPILLLGTPGSGVERIAALLADQPELVVLRDRITGISRPDEFNMPNFAHYCGDLTEADREALRERWLAPLRGFDVDTSRTVVDWLPRWDAHLLALVRRAMPGTRLVIVERDPRDALVNWLAFGWGQGFRCDDAVQGAAWLARARRHLAWGSELDEPRRLVVAADPILDDPQGAGGELARFLGLQALVPGGQLRLMERNLGGLPARSPAGHWQLYRDVLAEAFAQFDVQD
jgi:tetratricopeptide (TPR) repeat protein